MRLPRSSILHGEGEGVAERPTTHLIQYLHAPQFHSHGWRQVCAAGTVPQVLPGRFPSRPLSSCSSSNYLSNHCQKSASSLSPHPTSPSLPFAFPLSLRYRNIAIRIATIIDMDFFPRYNPYLYCCLSGNVWQWIEGFHMRVQRLECYLCYIT